MDQKGASISPSLVSDLDSLEQEKATAKLCICNCGTVAAVGVKLEQFDELSQHFIYFLQNYLYLLPGEETNVLLTFIKGNCDNLKIRISGFGIEEQVIGCM